MAETVQAKILVGDCREALKGLEPESIHCVVTSPPYWGLRDYGVDGQIGLEPTPEEHIGALLEVFREVRRVLRKDGTLWLNYGDCYACQKNGRSAADTNAAGNDDRTFRDKPFSTVTKYAHRLNKVPRGTGPNRSPQMNLKPKDLVGMPWAVAFALRADGWWLRSDVIWSKPNPMPSSVTDRPTMSHEYVFLLTKSALYYYDSHAIREPVSADSLRENKNGTRGKEKANAAGQRHTGPEMRSHWEKIKTDPAGRSKRTVWEIATQPTPDAHFATFPEALVEPCILAGTSEWGCCSECGAPWVRQTKPTEEYAKNLGSNKGADADRYGAGYRKHSPAVTAAYETTGWQPSCSCNAETVPCVVLDPFGGSGTVGRVSTRLGRRSILIELNPRYVNIARKKNSQTGMGL